MNMFLGKPDSIQKANTLRFTTYAKLHAVQKVSYKEILGTLGRSIIYVFPFLVLAQHLIDGAGDRISSDMDLDAISWEYSYVLKDTWNTSLNLF